MSGIEKRVRLRRLITRAINKSHELGLDNSLDVAFEITNELLLCYTLEEKTAG